MKLTWLAGSGLLFETEKLTVVIDPYLSDSMGNADEKKQRRIPIPEKYVNISPDVILITHSHKDHMDLETLGRLLSQTDKTITVLAAESVYKELSKLGYEHNLVLFAPHSVWSEGGVTFYSVRAEHSDRTAVGFILDDGEKTYYVSGDTLYNFDVIDDVLELVEDGVDYAFLPINGRGNNMNARDAADFAYEIEAKRAIPVHYGLFDSLTPAEFDFDDALILTPFETVNI